MMSVSMKRTKMKLEDGLAPPSIMNKGAYSPDLPQSDSQREL